MTEAFGLYALSGKALVPGAGADRAGHHRDRKPAAGRHPADRAFLIGLLLLVWVKPEGETSAETWSASSSHPCAAGGTRAGARIRWPTSCSARTGPDRAPPQPPSAPTPRAAPRAGALPETGPTWQAMRLSPQPQLGPPRHDRLSPGLSREAVRIGWRTGFYIGDISQPRGGPMTSGHASHQIGLDADIWMLPPQPAEPEPGRARASVRSRSAPRISARSTPTGRAGTTRCCAPRLSDPQVDRIFVAAAVKIEMCRTATRADTPWLQKIRPIRAQLSLPRPAEMPARQRHCQTQTPTVASCRTAATAATRR
jgi:penicillin-insensitive murein DD-endopeptidase